MKIVIEGRNVKPTAALKDYTYKKIDKLDKILKNVVETRVDLYHDKSGKEGNSERCEITVCLTGGQVIRAEEFAGDMYAAVDLCQETLEKQIRKFKEKRLSARNQEKKFRDKLVDIVWKTARGFGFSGKKSDQEKEYDEHGHKIPKVIPTGKIVKRKRFQSTAKPMTEKEAMLQMELIDHDFFLFKNADTDRFSVLYKRKDGNYGLIEPDLGEE
jgi:putative sigma-54 modulation protein